MQVGGVTCKLFNCKERRLNAAKNFKKSSTSFTFLLINKGNKKN